MDENSLDILRSQLLITLLKGVLYREDDVTRWQQALDHEAFLRDHLKPLGLTLILDQAEGYAYLKQMDADSEETLPRLIPRRALSYPVSLLLALLRKRLTEQDASQGERLILTREQLVDLLRLFFAEGSNEARLVDRMDAHIAKVVELGFLRKLRAPAGEVYEVRRILKAFVDAQWLNEFDERLAEYHKSVKDGE